MQMPVNTEVMYPHIMEGFLPVSNLFIHLWVKPHFTLSICFRICMALNHFDDVAIFGKEFHHLSPSPLHLCTFRGTGFYQADLPSPLALLRVLSTEVERPCKWQSSASFVEGFEFWSLEVPECLLESVVSLALCKGLCSYRALHCGRLNLVLQPWGKPPEISLKMGCLCSMVQYSLSTFDILS